MGLLALGTAYTWNDAKQHAEHVREHGIEQFLAIWDRLQNRVGDGLLWGDEIEYMVVSLDEKHRNARLSLRQSEILDELRKAELAALPRKPGADILPTFHPEYGRYMLESTPGAPYGATLKDMLAVEPNMRWRRRIARQKLYAHEIPVTLTSYPRLGVKGVFLDPHHEPLGDASHSLFVPDQIINPHVRFPTLTANIRKRRGSKVAMNLPIFVDERTPQPFIDPSIPWDRDAFPEDAEAKNGAALPNHIYMDAMGFGMGASCLQITFQAWNLDEARRVYDALVPVGPIMLALTAASPAWRGYLADVDCRWDVIAGSVDDRTPEERGLRPLEHDRYVIPKSRYDSVDSYLSRDIINRPEYNDNPLPINEKAKARLMSQGVDELLANHIAHLFIRDPLVVFSETLDQDDRVSTDHFENIQSTNWQTMRFKPPPPNSDIGWRVEFRPMEVQLTDFENAAFSIFIVLLSRAILSFGLNFYIPVSKVDVNMQRAQQRDACRQGRFYFRKQVFPPRHHARQASRSASPAPGVASRPTSPHRVVEEPTGPVEDEYEEMTLDEIINGKPAPGSMLNGNGHAESLNGATTGGFPGLLGLVRAYVAALNVDVQTQCALDKYFELVRQRADGSLLTTASWIRRFVRQHPSYAYDSVVSQEINYDLIREIDAIERGQRKADDLLGRDYVGSDSFAAGGRDPIRADCA